MSTIIYHNPKCGTSRNVLAIIRATDEEPEIVEYLKNPPSRERITELAAAAGLAIRDLLRERGTPYHELGLDDKDLSDDALLDAIEAHPILLNRPIVETSKGTVLARPKDKVIPILEKPLPDDYEI